MSVKLSWKNYNDALSGIEIYRELDPILDIAEHEPLAQLEPEALEYEDASALYGMLYYYRIVFVRGDKRVATNNIEVKTEAHNGPGPQRIIKGDRKAGLFGWVPPQEVLTNDEIFGAFWPALLTSLSQRTVDGGWLKFSIDDKILYLSVHGIAYSVNYLNLYNFGLVYGTDDEGLVVPSNTNPVNQLRVLAKGNDEFKVRLPDGWGDTTDVTYSVPANSTTELNLGASAIFPTSELSKMFGLISGWYSLAMIKGPGNTTNNSATAYAPVTTLLQLPEAANNFSTSCIHSLISGNGSNAGNSQRTSTLYNNAGSTRSSATIGSFIGWRPVLELL